MNNGTLPLQQLDPGSSPVTEICDYLRPECVATDLSVSSKKRLLEEMAGLLQKGNSKLNRDTVFRVLTERERLGSTGIGNGVALPHGRVNGLDQPIVALARLRRPVDFDAVDESPIALAIGLLVAADAHDDHLQLLAGLARLFGNDEILQQVLAADNADALYALLQTAECGA